MQAHLSHSHLSIVGRCSNKIQLASGLNEQGRLTDDAIERGINCLRQFKQILDEYPIEKMQVVATQALRQASNSEDFMRLAKAEGFDIDIISGTREASLIFRGVTDPLPDSNKNRLVIDIGGASTELTIGNNKEILLAESMSMGCVSWRDLFFKNDVMYSKNGKLAKAAALAELNPLIKALSQLHWDEVYASSGSAKMMAHIAYANQWSEGEISAECVHKIENALGQVGHCSKIQLDGLDPARVDLLAPGLSILSTIMETLKIPLIYYSYTALREGLLSEMSNHRIDRRLIPAEELLP